VRTVYLPSTWALTAPLRALSATPYRDRCHPGSDEITYYRKRSNDHQGQARCFRVLTWSAQTLGIVGGALKAVGVLDLDLLGIGAACAAATTAWQQTRDHVMLARAYQVTAEDLEQVKADLPVGEDEREWGACVADAEATMSREHVMWTARRGGDWQG
jgi:hypothetical protein